MLAQRAAVFRHVARQHRQCKASFSSAPIIDGFKWGNGFADDFNNKLGRPTASAVYTPELLKLPNRKSLKTAAFGPRHAVYLSTDGDVFVTGLNKEGQLGLGDVQPHDGVSLVPGLSNAAQVACGGYHTVVADKTGQVFTCGWGGNQWYSGNLGGLGHGDSKSQHSFKQVEALKGEKISQVAAGTYHSLALTQAGTLFAWGRGEYGRLGNGGSSAATSPLELGFFKDIPLKKIVACNSHSVALSKDGQLYAWGRNEYGQLGQAVGLSLDVHSMEPVPVLIEALADEIIVDVACGNRHMVAVSDTGTLYFWGDRQWPVPHSVRGNNDSLASKKFIKVAAGKGFSAAIEKENGGSLFTWGSSSSGCLGHGAGVKSTKNPLFVQALQDAEVLDVFAGGQNIAVLTKRLYVP